MARDTSRDGFRNKLETFALTNFKGLWNFIQRTDALESSVNKFLINNAIYKIPTRPFPYSMMTLEEHIPDTDIPKKTDTYTSWDSLTDRTYTGRHLPPAPAFNRSEALPEPEALAVLFRKKGGETRFSEKSTLLFPYWVQWFTDGFLRTERNNRLKNTSNHQIDLSPVYGLTRKASHLLRTFQGGKLKSQIINGEEYPQFYYEDPEQDIVKAEFKGLYEPLNDEQRLPPEKKAMLFAMGVERANVQIGYVMLNVLCLREHNRICDLLAQAYPDWDDERLFQTARNIVVVTIMKIVVEEYVNHITPYHFNFKVDPSAFTHEKWYRQNWMSIEFDFVYRWHSALPETLVYDGQSVPMVASLWHNQMLTSRGLAALMAETCAQPATQIGLFNTPEFLVDLTEVPSIRMGRQVQLASYNDYREMCQFPRVTDFDQISRDRDTQKYLKDFYGTVDNIEFYVGLYAEDVRPNSALGPLVGRLIGIDAFSQVLTNPLLADTIFNQDTFSPVGWESIHETRSLEDIVHRNIPQTGELPNITFYR
ncbi:heme peroxidase [Romeria aff. gracilis LEGE 07310]|uniref:Heme peroxidase n=1 Tax=Vasconcelosia minhoensis LEGE 07310 TaxID=915328 RepID=A0A8J7DA51_9CYAN|nr:peroxidase family protein [Romeria gracilis]MBE9076042.1 heme peroxidase [Romeria aff. gracilis LEGE 07310]